jgi:hypothetical protein
MNRGRHKKKKIIPLTSFCKPNDCIMIKQSYLVEGFKNNKRVFKELMSFDLMLHIHVYGWLRRRKISDGWDKIVINNQIIDINH